MNKQRPDQPNPAEDDEALLELTSVLPASDRLRFAALGRISSLSAAKQKSLLRQEKAVVARHGTDSPEAKSSRRRLQVEKRFDTAVKVEIQRTQADVVSRNPEALTLHGRVVNPQRLAVPQMTVSATDDEGRAVVFASSNDNGYFSLEVPANSDTVNENVTLLVSDENQAVFYRGTECFARKPGTIFYRELVIGTADPISQPTPPPDVDPKSVTVPDVRGLREDTARAQIRAVGLSVESSTKESGKESVGRVLDQNPKPGVNVARCSTVAIVIGAPQKVAVPNLVGMTLRDARAAIEKADLSMGRIEPSGASAQAKVVQQAPAAGEQVEQRTLVRLVVEGPVQNAKVPTVLRLSLAAAKRAIIGAGLVIGRVQPADASGRGIVVSQAPTSGKEVAPGTAVDVIVREPASKAVVPNVVDLRLAAAKETLKKARLKTGKINPPDASEESVVVKQLPAAGGEVDEGTAVDLELRAPSDNQLQPKKAKSGKSAEGRKSGPRVSNKKAKKPRSKRSKE